MKNLIFLLSLIFFVSSCANIIIEFESSNGELLEELSLKNIILPSGLALDEGAVDPDIDEYNLYVPVAYSILVAIPIPNLNGVEIKIVKDGIEGNLFSDFPLSVGDNLFEIRLSKGDLSAIYYLNVIKWKELSNYIKPDVPISNQQFGWHLSMHNEYIAVGAPEETTAAGAEAGAVYLFKQSGGDWVQEARILAPNASANDKFGHSLYLYDNILIVGAPYEDSNTAGISPDTSSANDSGTDIGAAYVFKRDALGNWNLEYYIKPSDPVNGVIFGFAVALDKNNGETILFGAPYDSIGAGYSGAVYVFKKDNLGVISQTAKLKASAPSFGAVFGGSFYVYNTRIVVGAPYDDTYANNAGLVYVFDKNELDVWNETAILHASNFDIGDYFGFSVVTYDDVILIGAPIEDSDPNIGLADNSLTNSGIVYEFTLQGALWVETAYFKADNADAFDRFGWNMDFDKNSVVIGAPYEAGSGVGVNPPDDNLSVDSGAVYIFKKDISGDWEQDSYVKATNNDSNDKFGHSVIIDAGRLLIVASDEQSLDPNDPSNNIGVGAGAVYFYE